MGLRPVSRRTFLAAAGGTAAGALLAGSTPQDMPGSLALLPGGSPPGRSGYAPDGVAGRTAAFPLPAVRLLDSPFRANQARNTDYLLFVDPDRMLHTFRLNYGLPSAAEPCGGWERPESEVRGHTTGHLLSALAITYANTGSRAALAKGRYIVGQLAVLQALASVRRIARQPMTFGAVADGKPVTLIPVARAHHQHYTVYWRTVPASSGPATVTPPAPGPVPR